ncbi:MAG: response regulator [Clostridiales bacterium]|nr:response regulator [Clostridiales bacterium]
MDTKFMPLSYIVIIMFAASCLYLSNAAPRDEGRRTPMYVNFMECPAYIREGFDLNFSHLDPDLVRFPADSSGINVPLRLVNSGLPLDKYRPLEDSQGEFTIIIPFELSGEAETFLSENKLASPGLYFAHIGDNWEIFLNGALIRSEVYLDTDNRIATHRSMRDIFFPIDKTILASGTNLLAVRIIGDPLDPDVGLYYQTPYYMDDYANIAGGYNGFITVVMSGIFLFTGFYYLLVFTDNRKAHYNLYFGLLSIIVCVYYIARSRWIHSFVADSSLAFQLEYAFVYIMIPLLGAFIETLNERRISLTTVIFTGTTTSAVLAQGLMAARYRGKLLSAMSLLVFIYIAYLFYHVLRRIRDNAAASAGKTKSFAKEYLRALIFTTLGRIGIYSLIGIICGCLDIVDALFFHYSLNISSYGMFVFVLGIAVSLAERLNALYNRLDTANAALEEYNADLNTVVRSRTWELEAQTQLAESSSKARSVFLAKTSHEIRAPMNTIISAAELLLRQGGLPQGVWDDVRQIRLAGAHLIRIVDDILDFSKIEAGKIEIVHAPYEVASLLSDVFGVIRAQLAGKPILFAAVIDAGLPKTLIGDYARNRQILLNLLNNAVKYTREGWISIAIAGRVHGDDTIMLVVDITDTGTGMREKDMRELFSDFAQFAASRNHNAAGAKLGLAITRSLCRLMGGYISAYSEYGEGSVFTVAIPQKIKDNAPFAQVEFPSAKRVVIYDAREPYARLAAACVKSLDVSCRLAANAEDFKRAIIDEQPKYIFIAARQFKEGFAAAQKLAPWAQTVLIPENCAEASPPPNARVMPMPVYPGIVADILNNRPPVCYSIDEGIGVKFIAPEAEILVANDLAASLKVVRGLLAPFEVRVDCSSGARAVEMITNKRYDLVFIDQRMSGMDGAETVAAIRGLENEYFKSVPIVALTARETWETKEFFLAHGFNDYLVTPIKIPQLYEILERWIPERLKHPWAPRELDGRDGAANGLVIDGVDVKRGIELTGGQLDIYVEVITLYCRDVEKRMPLLAQPPDEDGLLNFTTNVHALKSVSGTIGAAAVSRQAAELEAAGRDGDLAAITARLGSFRENISALTARIRAVLPQHEESSKEIERDILETLKQEISAGNVRAVDEIFRQLWNQPLDAEVKAKLSDASDMFIMAETETALEILDSIAKKYYTIGMTKV